jgi:4-hydroxy-2-oxoheptanedioate aldolase
MQPHRSRPVLLVCLLVLGGAAADVATAQQRVRLNPLIAKLEQGQIAYTGGDWTFVDMEHGPYLLDRLQTILSDHGAKKRPDGGWQVAPIVRIPLEGDEPFRFAVKQVLDSGAMGIVFPRIETRAQAVEAVRAMRYPPQRGGKYPEPAGRRGWGPGRAAALWGLQTIDYAFQYADVWPLNPQGELFVMLMIESPDGVKNIDDILTVPGIGAVHIGASDLGVSLGVGPPNPNNPPETEAAVQRVLKSCIAHKVACGYPAVFGGDAEVKRRADQGFKVLQVSGSAAPGAPAAPVTPRR